MEESYEEVDLEEQLYQELEASPVVELIGLVDPSGVGGFRTEEDDPWTLIMALDAFRVGADAIRKETLLIRSKVDDEALEKYEGLIEAEAIVRLQVRLSEDNCFESPQALLIECLESNLADAELHEYLVELQKPITHDDARFGTLVFDRSLNWFTAEVDWCDVDIDLCFALEDPAELENALKVANTLWDDQQGWQQRAVDFAIEELLPIKNEHWLEGGEPDVTADEFKRRMAIVSISAYPDGEFEFWFNDGDLFWGHAIQVSGNLTDGLTYADIPG